MLLERVVYVVTLRLLERVVYVGDTDVVGESGLCR